MPSLATIWFFLLLLLGSSGWSHPFRHQGHPPHSIAELNDSAAVQKVYIWGLDLSGSMRGAGGVGGLAAVDSKVSPAEVSFVSYDGNGNVTGLTKATDGTTSAEYAYGPFGELLRKPHPGSTYASVNPFLFSTKYWDVESDFLYYGYRFYDPNRGRWLSRDPIGEAGGLNIYAFCHNSAVNYVDANGDKPIFIQTGGTIVQVDDYDVYYLGLQAALDGHRYYSDDMFQQPIRAFCGTSIEMAFGPSTDFLRAALFLMEVGPLGPLVGINAVAESATTLGDLSVNGEWQDILGESFNLTGNIAATSLFAAGLPNTPVSLRLRPRQVPAQPNPYVLLPYRPGINYSFETFDQNLRTLTPCAAKGTPRGFSSPEQFAQATSELEMALAKSGITDASIGVRGSSVTGVSFKTGKPFGPGSDIDFFVESGQLTQGLSTSPNIPGFVHPNKIGSCFDPIAEWSQIWSENLGRKVSVGGFQPGTVPVGPVIR